MTTALTAPGDCGARAEDPVPIHHAARMEAVEPGAETGAVGELAQHPLGDHRQEAFADLVVDGDRIPLDHGAEAGELN